MRTCQICNEPIWDNEWPTSVGEGARKFVCYYCYRRLKDGNYRPKKIRENEVNVCDKCGEASENVKEVNSEWLCEDCRNLI